MTRIILPLALVTTTLALALPEQAALTRTFVSAAGSDSNPCTITQPCATFAHAYSLTAASGIIAALDPGKYGPITITGPITINGNGWAAMTAPAGGNGITINAGSSDAVELNGLEIDGAAAAYNGIVFNSGGSVTVTNCVVQNFFNNGGATTGNGILIKPTTGSINFAITNTTVSNNGFAGINYSPPSGSASAKGIIDHVTAANNNEGIGINSSFNSGVTVVAVSNSVASNNSNFGILVANAGPFILSIDNVTASGNGIGIEALNTPKVLLGRSVITGSGSYGVYNGTSPNSFYTYQDNRINWNTPDTGGLTMISTPVQ